INLSTEVSNIDPTASFQTPGGFNIPGLATRRASSTVELADGESFALAGLIKNENQNVVKKFPILGDIPILGALFRSTDFQQNKSELVIVVTPHLVKPTRAERLELPTDGVVPPNRFDQYLMGRVQGLAPEGPAPEEDQQPQGADQVEDQAGMEGTYGHQL
ncbi:MAG TPA: type II and III secretion system protein family protein, partial [Gammaproteobacteria bacterium]|nr:type II and III secretion system protein family protein [Gammaproteobacteria bacterium]